MAAVGSVAQDFQGIADLSVCKHLTITYLGECAWSVHALAHSGTLTHHK